MSHGISEPLPSARALRHQRRRGYTVHDLQGTQANAEGVGVGRGALAPLQTANGSITRWRRSSAAP